MKKELENLADGHGSMVAAQELGLDFEEPDNIEYLGAAINVFRRAENDGDRFDVVIEHPALTSDELRDFLALVAPSKFADSKYGIIADWDILDDPDTQNRVAQRLVALHARLGSSWNEFALSQPAFIRTMRGIGPTYLGSPGRHPISKRLIAATEFGEEIFKNLKATVGAKSEKHKLFLELLTNAGVEDPENFLMERMKAEVNRKQNPRRDKITNPKTIVKRFNHLGTKRRGNFMNLLIADLDEEQTQAFWLHLQETMYDEFTAEDGQSYFVPRIVANRPPEQSYNDTITLRDGYYEADFEWVPTDDGRLERVLVPGSLRLVETAPAISPLLAWRRDMDGKRSFIYERHKERGEPYRDGVLGALAVAYFSPEERDSWPDRLPIGDSRTQAMGAAQVPVLALMRSVQLLKTDFVEAAESLAA